MSEDGTENNRGKGEVVPFPEVDQTLKDMSDRIIQAMGIFDFYHAHPLTGEFLEEDRIEGQLRSVTPEIAEFLGAVHVQLLDTARKRAELKVLRGELRMGKERRRTELAKMHQEAKQSSAQLQDLIRIFDQEHHR